MQDISILTDAQIETLIGIFANATDGETSEPTVYLGVERLGNGRNRVLIRVSDTGEFVGYLR